MKEPTFEELRSAMLNQSHVEMSFIIRKAHEETREGDVITVIDDAEIKEISITPRKCK